MPHSRSLDALRGLSALAVLVFHASCGGFRGGFLGVDLFFAISGFLITSRLMADFEHHGSVQFGSFYLRRACRLLPALVVTLLVARLFWLGEGYWTAASATLLYVANWRVLGTSAGILGHTWSLSIEEQFYLVWPLTLSTVLALCRTRRRATAATLGLVLLLAAARAALRARGSFLADNYSTLVRMDELLIGGAFALWPRSEESPVWAWRLATPAVLVALGVVMAVESLAAPWLLWGGYSLFALGAAHVVRQVSFDPGGLVARLLDRSVLVEIGRRSYGVYLFHPLILDWLVFMHERGSFASHALIVAVCLALTLLAAWASFRWIEAPILQLAQRRPAPAPEAS